MFDLLKSIVQFLAEAVYTYAASVQGLSELKDIANQAEALGIDVPFYNPTSQEGQSGDVGDAGDMGANGQSDSVEVSTFSSRHPQSKAKGS